MTTTPDYIVEIVADTTRATMQLERARLEAEAWRAWSLQRPDRRDRLFIASYWGVGASPADIIGHMASRVVYP